MKLNRARGLSTIRVKFQVAATNVLKLVELARLSHVDFRSDFGTVLQDVRRVLPSPKTTEEPVPKVGIMAHILPGKTPDCRP